MKSPLTHVLSTLVLCLTTSAAIATDVVVKDAWVRGTVAGQQATGAFMELGSKSGASIVGASSPLAGTTEIHEMSMDGGIMRMRAVPRLDLPAGKVLQLGPSGYHVMLIDLKQVLKKGDTVPLTLRVEGPDKKQESVTIKAEVRELSAAPATEHKH